MAVERDKIVRSGSHVTRPTVEPDPLNRRSSEPIVRHSRGNHHSLTGFSREISDPKRPTEALLHGRSALSETAVTSKMTTTLRLPSFEALGIAAPHPDRISSGGLRNVSAILNQGALSTSSPRSTLKANRGDSVKEESLERSCCASVPSQHSAGPHVQSRMGYLSMLTPPDENFQIDWIETTPGGSTHPTSLQPASQEPPPHSCNSIPMVSSCSSTPADVVNLRGCDGSQDNNPPPQSTIATGNLPQGYGSDQSPFERSWLSDALDVLGMSTTVLDLSRTHHVQSRARFSRLHPKTKSKWSVKHYPVLRPPDFSAGEVRPTTRLHLAGRPKIRSRTLRQQQSFLSLPPSKTSVQPTAGDLSSRFITPSKLPWSISTNYHLLLP